jgi:hypothetical protein
MRKNYNNWMAESMKELTPTGKIKRPSYETVVNWVNASWNAVDIGIIRRSFKCCGISNKRDGSEDDLIFDYERIGQSKKATGNDEVEDINDDDNDDDYENSSTDNEDSSTDDENSSIDDDYYDEVEGNYSNEWND